MFSLDQFFIKFPKQIGNFYDIESEEFIHPFCFELEVIQLLMNQLNINLKFYFKQCHLVKQQEDGNLTFNVLYIFFFFFCT